MPGYGNAQSRAHAVKPLNGKVMFFTANHNGAACALKRSC